MKIENGKQYHYHEMGVKWLVTVIGQQKKDDQNHIELQVDEVLSMGKMIAPEKAPEVGSHINVMYTDGHEHYAGWSLREI